MSTVSILFAKEAEDLLNRGKSSEALEVCQRGIETYPEYPLGYLVLARCKFEQDDIYGTFEAANEGLSNHPEYKPLARFLELAEDALIIHEVNQEFGEDYDKLSDAENSEENNLKAESNPGQNNFLRLVSDYESNDTKDDVLKAGVSRDIPGLQFTPLRATRRNNQDEQYENSVKFPDFYNPYDSDDDNSISSEDSSTDYYTTETMAGILESQGANEEAIEAYLKLSEKFPEKADKFQKRINELREKI